jgi:hypothetical protein
MSEARSKVVASELNSLRGEIMLLFDFVVTNADSVFGVEFIRQYSDTQPANLVIAFVPKLSSQLEDLAEGCRNLHVIQVDGSDGDSLRVSEVRAIQVSMILNET